MEQCLIALYFLKAYNERARMNMITLNGSGFMIFALMAGLFLPAHFIEIKQPSDRHLPCTMGEFSTKKLNADTHQFAAIEMIGFEMDIDKIKSIAKKEGVIDPQVYTWKNHWVLYAKLSNVENLRQRLALEYPKTKIKIYERPIYQFSRLQKCKDKNIAAEWEHVLLTANLVKDAQLQQEYINYHNTQFEKWPEVSQGFCNASFQQLQIFKNGRQLMLVISIPKGESLDELNPKTMENNSRVNDWNELMKKYQTGIKGTKPDEVWVFLDKITGK